MNDINLTHAFAVGIGATLGAWLRWLLGLLFNSAMPNLPLGTLAANLSGGLMMGIAFGFFMASEVDNHTLRLFITTGFLGGLTTFSAFSGESLALMLKHQYGWMMIHTFSHVIGALIMAILGYLIVQWCKS
jgi:fluoride exporter